MSTAAAPFASVNAMANPTRHPHTVRSAGPVRPPAPAAIVNGALRNHRAVPALDEHRPIGEPLK